MLRIDSLPENGYVPDRTYSLVVTLTRPGMGRGGFELAARVDEASGWNKQAGTLTLQDPERTQISKLNPGPVRYLTHTKNGTTLTTPDTARWLFQWRAPPRGGPVVFHVAANAANDDDSELGDFIYTAEYHLVSAP